MYMYVYVCIYIYSSPTQHALSEHRKENTLRKSLASFPPLSRLFCCQLYIFHHQASMHAWAANSRGHLGWSATRSVPEVNSCHQSAVAAAASWYSKTSFLRMQVTQLGFYMVSCQDFGGLCDKHSNVEMPSHQSLFISSVVEHIHISEHINLTKLQY